MALLKNMSLLIDIFGSAPLGSYGVRNSLNVFFCKYGWGESTPFQLNNKIDTYHPLAKFIYTKGVDAWEPIANREDVNLKFHCLTVLEMSLAGCIFTEKVNKEYTRNRGGSPKSDYFNKKFYKELCTSANDYQRALMIQQVNEYYYPNNFTMKIVIDEETGLAMYNGEPINPPTSK